MPGVLNSWAAVLVLITPLRLWTQRPRRGKRRIGSGRFAELRGLIASPMAFSSAMDPDVPVSPL